jgi:hypothetical protein
MRSVWTRSPQEVDPLSWFAGPRLPVVLAIAGVAQGAAITALYWPLWSSVALQFIAMPVFLAAGLLAAFWTQPHRPQLRPRQAAIVLFVGAAGLLLSAAGTINSSVPLEQWWPGIVFGVTLASLAPYSSARQMAAYSVPAVALVAVVGTAVFSSISNFWPLIGILVISAGPVVIAGVVSVVFCYTVVSRTLAHLDTAAGVEEVYQAAEELDEFSETGTVARASARVAPFLAAIADAGVITLEDRALAAQIARGLRTELVTAANRSWLDVVAKESGMIVSDPSRLADRMNESQRTALRGLLVAALDSPLVDRQTLLIELRGQEDGSTAVALSIDVDLPEGRRLLLFAPYYLTLKTTVDDLSWDGGRSLMLNFRIPASGA